MNREGSFRPPLEIALEAPTRVRYQVLGFLGAMTFILYLDRVCISQATPLIKKDLGLSDTAMGFVFGAFTLAYGLFELPTGWWGDRYGARGVLTRIVLWWSLFTALTGAATGFWMLMVVRFLFGAGEAGALPNAALVTRRWFPESSRGTAQGIVTTAMLVGGVISPIAAQALLKRIGWEWSFVVFGAVGAFWALAFYLWFRDNPADHPAVNQAEVQLIRGGRAAQHHPATAHGPIPWRLALGNLNFWLMGGLMNCGAAVFYMIISWYPTYLQEGRKVSADLSGWLTGLVLFGGAAGCVMGGRLADRRLTRTGDPRRAYSRLGSSAFGLGALALLTALQCESAVLAACFTSLAFLCQQTALPAWWATVTKISGQHVGALFGLMNSMGIIGGIASQLFLGALADWLKDQGFSGRDQWDPGIYAYVAVMLTAMILWLFVDPRKSLVERELASVEA